MKIIITNYDRNRKIQAIKAIRSVTNMSLKDSKDLIDSVASGLAQTIEPVLCSLADARAFLDVGCVVYKIENDEIQIAIKTAMNAALKNNRLDILKVLIQASEMSN